MLPTCSKPSFLRMPEQTDEELQIGTCFEGLGFSRAIKGLEIDPGFSRWVAASEMTLPAASEAVHPRTQEPNG